MTWGTTQDDESKIGFHAGWHRTVAAVRLKLASSLGRVENQTQRLSDKDMITAMDVATIARSFMLPAAAEKERRDRKERAKEVVHIGAGVYRDGLGRAFVFNELCERRYIPKNFEEPAIRGAARRYERFGLELWLDQELGTAPEGTMLRLFEEAEQKRRRRIRDEGSQAQRTGCPPCGCPLGYCTRRRFTSGSQTWVGARDRFVDQEIGG